MYISLFFFSSRRRHTRSLRDWSSDVCSSDLEPGPVPGADAAHPRNILEGELESGPPFLRAAVLSERQPASQQHACISHVWVVSATQKPLRRPRARPRTQSRQVTVRSEP